MYDIKPPEHIWRIRLIRMNCLEKCNTCRFKSYNPWVRQYKICTLKEPFHVRRTKIDKNGRIYLDPESKPVCCIKILDQYYTQKQTVPYASSEIEYMKEIIG